MNSRVSSLFQSFYRSPTHFITKRFYGKTVRYPWMNKHEPYWIDQYAAEKPNEDLTEQNKEFLKEERIEKINQLVSPFAKSEIVRNPYEFKTQRCGLVGFKIGLYPLWTKKGKKIDCTVIQIPDNHVISYTPPEEVLDQFPSLLFQRGYWKSPNRGPAWLYQKRWGVQLVGAVSADPIEFTEAWCEKFTRVGVPPKRKISRFLVSPDAALHPGMQISIHHFRVGDFIDVTARTINRGFQGAIERWQMSGGPAGLGSTKFHRKMGSLAGGGGPVVRGKRMPGVMGNRYRSLRSIQIMRINPRLNLLYVHGPTPGPIHSYCQLNDTWMTHRRNKMLESGDTPPMPTWLPEDEANASQLSQSRSEDYSNEEDIFADDIYHDSILTYDAPLIRYDQ